MPVAQNTLHIDFTRQFQYNTVMRKVVRAILIAKNGRLVFMKRNRPGTEYYTALGGGVESGETDDVALRRELMEESGSTVGDLTFAFEYIHTYAATDGNNAKTGNNIKTSNNTSIQHFYIAHEIDRATPTGEEWTIRNTPDNKFEIVEIPRDQIANINLLPIELKDYILKKLNTLNT